MATLSSSVIAFVIDYRGAFFSTGCREFPRAVAVSEGAMKFGEMAGKDDDSEPDNIHPSVQSESP
jgi:hypothetical protein